MSKIRRTKPHKRFAPKIQPLNKPKDEVDTTSVLYQSLLVEIKSAIPSMKRSDIHDVIDATWKLVMHKESGFITVNLLYPPEWEVRSFENSKPLPVGLMGWEVARVDRYNKHIENNGKVITLFGGKRGIITFCVTPEQCKELAIF